MLWRWLLVFSCLCCVLGIRDNELDPSICEEDLGLLNCTCTQRQNITIGMILDPAMAAIEIHHCGYVTIHPTAFPALNLHYLLFDDILELDVKGASLFAMGSLDFLQLANIASLKTERNSFQIVNTSKVLLLNVTAPYLDAYSLNAEGVVHFLVSNCTFGTVAQGAFHLQNPQFFFFMNTSVEILQTGAVQINGSTIQVYIYNTSFNYVERRAFQFESAMYLSYQQCSFHFIQSNMVEGEVSSFAFYNNAVDIAEPNIFSSLNASTLYRVTQNVFKEAQLGALAYNYDAILDVNTENNTFNCNCRLIWIFEEKYERFRKSSFCSDRTGKLLAVNELKRAVVQSEWCEDNKSQGTTDSLPLPRERTTSAAPIPRDQICFTLFPVILIAILSVVFK